MRTPEADSGVTADHSHLIAEAHAAKIRPSPKKPSGKDVDLNYAIHCPFRSWCLVCVAASAKEAPHKRRDEKDREKGLLDISLDYEMLEE